VCAELRWIQASLKRRADGSFEVMGQGLRPEAWKHHLVISVSTYEFSESMNPRGGRGDDDSPIPPKAPKPAKAEEPNMRLHQYARPRPVRRIDAEKVCPKLVVANAQLENCPAWFRF
jgi:hypothetical protein